MSMDTKVTEESVSCSLEPLLRRLLLFVTDDDSIASMRFFIQRGNVFSKETSSFLEFKKKMIRALDCGLTNQ